VQVIIEILCHLKLISFLCLKGLILFRQTFEVYAEDVQFQVHDTRFCTPCAIVTSGQWHASILVCAAATSVVNATLQKLSKTAPNTKLIEKLSKLLRIYTSTQGGSSQ